jgi:hypothetical protein
LPAPSSDRVSAGAPSLTPLATTEASARASLVPSAAAKAADAIARLQPNIAVRVGVATLDVRERPSPGANKIGAMVRDDVAVLEGYGPIRAGGFTWYEAARVEGLRGELPALPADPLDGSWNQLAGWIAVGDDAGSFVSSLRPRCPTAVDLVTLSAMLEGERLACLGGKTITLEGTYGCVDCGGAIPGEFLPVWLATPLAPGFLSARSERRLGPLALYFPPNTARPVNGSIIRVKGHVDDPLAATCSVSVASGSDPETLVPLDHEDAVMYCRQRLVAESYDVLGTDPAVPGA